MERISRACEALHVMQRNHKETIPSLPPSRPPSWPTSFPVLDTGRLLVPKPNLREGRGLRLKQFRENLAVLPSVFISGGSEGCGCAAHVTGRGERGKWRVCEEIKVAYALHSSGQGKPSLDGEDPLVAPFLPPSLPPSSPDDIATCPHRGGTNVHDRADDCLQVPLEDTVDLEALPGGGSEVILTVVRA